MPPNKEEFPKGLPINYPDNGGSLYAPSYDGEGVVAYTKFGEFACQLTDEANLIANFMDQGMILIYAQEGQLLSASIDVGQHLMEMDYDEATRMPNHGHDIIGLVDYLKRNKLLMFVNINMVPDRSFWVVVADEHGEQQIVKELKGVDLTKGLGGDIGIQDHSIAFEIIENQGEDLVFAFGERGRDRVALSEVETSLFVNFEDDLFGDDPQRLQKLAAKIVLN